MIQNLNFDVNIEKRMPTTGKVFMVDRMTSDYAQAHPFDVDAFIEEVFQKYEQMVQEDAYARAAGWNKSREELRRQWMRTLSMPKQGDKSVCPWEPGKPQPALMEVWMKAGDYWRAGFRIGDLLPAFVPGHKITRLGNGEWICLFPKDMHLLDGHTNESDKVCNMIQNDVALDAMTHTPEPAGASFSQKSDSHQPKRPRRVQNSPTPSVRNAVAKPEELDMFAEEKEPMLSDKTKKKIMCGLAVAVVFLVLVNTVGLFGVAAIGLLAGGIVR